MIFSLFNPCPVYGLPSTSEWPVPPGLSNPASTRQGMRHSFEISILADEVGFDYVTVAEHHYHPRQLSPNPVVTAAAISQHLSRAGVAVLGATLPLVNPLRTAEEIAVLDAMCDGKLLVGLFRGTTEEFLTYGTNVSESREVFEEAVSLMLQAWTQPEPFSWVGRHYDFRTVAVWPRPVSVPHPTILVSANSQESAAHAARNHFKVGTAFAPATRIASVLAVFREEAERCGWTPEPEDMLYRSFCIVAETDDAAAGLAARSGFGGKTHALETIDSPVAAALRAARGVPGGPGPGGPPGGARPTFIGSPDTVTRQIREFAEFTGAGHFDLLFNDSKVAFEDAYRGAQLFGAEVLPQLHRTPVSA